MGKVKKCATYEKQKRNKVMETPVVVVIVISVVYLQFWLYKKYVVDPLMDMLRKVLTEQEEFLCQWCAFPCDTQDELDRHYRSCTKESVEKYNDRLETLLREYKE